MPAEWDGIICISAGRAATDKKTHGSDRFRDQSHGSDNFSDQQKKKRINISLVFVFINTFK